MNTKPICKALLSVSLVLCSNTIVASSPSYQSQTHVTRIHNEEDAVQSCVSQALHEAEIGDIEAFKSHLSPNFYMFERGVRYDTQGLVNILQQAQTSGPHMHWTVSQADVHVHGSSAWIAYVNDGSATVDGHSVHRQWLESAFLEKFSNTWKISFWHSTPVAGSADTNSAPAAKE